MNEENDFGAELTNEQLEYFYEYALSAVLTEGETEWIHVAIEPRGSVATCGIVGEPTAYFAPFFDVSSVDFCSTCGYVKATES